MDPRPSTAERAIPQTPFEETQEMIAYFQAQGETSVTRNHGLRYVVGPDETSLLSAEESPFGAPVRLAINNESEQSRDSFYVVDIRRFTQMRRGDGQVNRVLGNGATVTTSASATHLLVNRNFGRTEGVPGYAELSPGQGIEISRHSDDEATRKIMMERFGIYPIATSGYSRKRHASVSLGEDGESISVVDLGSSLGTYITTRKKPATEAKPDKLTRRSRVAGALRNVIGDGGAQFTNGYGHER